MNIEAEGPTLLSTTRVTRTFVFQQLRQTVERLACDECKGARCQTTSIPTSSLVPLQRVRISKISPRSAASPFARLWTSLIKPAVKKAINKEADIPIELSNLFDKKEKMTILPNNTNKVKNYLLENI